MNLLYSTFIILSILEIIIRLCVQKLKLPDKKIFDEPLAMWIFEIIVYQFQNIILYSIRYMVLYIGILYIFNPEIIDYKNYIIIAFESFKTAVMLLSVVGIINLLAAIYIKTKNKLKSTKPIITSSIKGKEHIVINLNNDEFEKFTQYCFDEQLCYNILYILSEDSKFSVACESDVYNRFLLSLNNDERNAVIKKNNLCPSGAEVKIKISGG